MILTVVPRAGGLSGTRDAEVAHGGCSGSPYSYGTFSALTAGIIAPSLRNFDLKCVALFPI